MIAFDKHVLSVTIGVIAVAALFSTMLVVSGAEAAPAQQETFRGLAQHIGTIAALPGNTPNGQVAITLVLSRWSTDEERDELAELLINESNQTLARELQNKESVGFIRATGSRRGIWTGAWQLRYARQFRDGDTRIIRLATDRPISFLEAMNQDSWTWEHQLSIIELQLDADGQGEGVLMAGVDLGVDGENNVLTMKNLSSQPVRLLNMRTSR